MSGNVLKTPLARSLNQFAERKVQDALQLVGKALPCSVTKVSGSIVTVKFEVNTSFTLPNVTCPVFGPEYIRYPLQVGCLGVVFSADARLGGVSGLGGGTPDLSLSANLSSLVFVPVGNANWSSPDDTQAVVLYGPNGVVLRTQDRAVSLVLSSSGVAINGNLTVTGEVTRGKGTSDQVTLGHHTHLVPGGGSTQPPTPGT